jgi:hypothetical protein
MNSDYKQFGPPNPTFFAVHAAIGNILHLTGRGETIEKLTRDLSDNSALLAHDGHCALLSVSKLSRFTTSRNAK